jgi:hypothetical protein
VMLKIVVNHLTRMQPGYVCVAGIDLRRHQHVRPVLGGARLTTDLLSREGGAFDIAALVDLGATRPCGAPPETEDHAFDSTRIVGKEVLEPGAFWKLLMAVSSSTLREIFGEELKPRRSGCAVDEGRGHASLGCLRSPRAAKIFINSWGKLRMRVSDGTFDVDLSVTDLRLYRGDQQTVRFKTVAEVQRRIAKGVGLILSVGLARAFRVSGDTARRHWLQVNNVHLEDDPVWTIK